MTSLKSRINNCVKGDMFDGFELLDNIHNVNDKYRFKCVLCGNIHIYSPTTIYTKNGRCYCYWDNISVGDIIKNDTTHEDMYVIIKKHDKIGMATVKCVLCDKISNTHIKHPHKCICSTHKQYNYYDRVNAIISKNYNHRIIKAHRDKIKLNKANINDQIISLDEYRKLVFQPCSYCGIKPYTPNYDVTPSNKVVSDFVIYTNGIDRIDSNRGYIHDNVCTCCVQCNMLKRDMDKDKFTQYLKNRYVWEPINKITPPIDDVILYLSEGIQTFGKYENNMSATHYISVM